MRRFVLVLSSMGLLTVPTVAGASTRLGANPDDYYPSGSVVGCAPQSYSPCSFVNLHSNNPDVQVASPIDGVITLWRMQGICCNPSDSTTRSISLATFVPAATDPGPGQSYSQYVKKTDGPTVTTPVGQTLNGSTLEIPVRVPIAAGERPGLILEYSTSISSDPVTGVYSAYQPSINNSAYAGQGAWNYNVQVEPDADHDGYGDETQDCDPLNASRNEPDGSCTILYPPPPPNPPAIIDPGGKCETACGGGVIFTKPVVYPRYWGNDPSFFYMAVNCPASNSEPCGGYVTVTKPKKSGKAGVGIAGRAKTEIVGKAKYLVKPGKKAQVKLKLSKAAKATLKSKGKLKVQILITPNSGDRQVLSKTLVYKKTSGKH